MSLPDVVLHIGQPKTGTTTFQNLLAQHRDRFCEVGVLYPDLGQVNQWLVMGELLLQDPETQVRLPTGLRDHLTELLAGRDGQFDRLARQCREFSGARIIISAENLVYAGEHTVERLYDVFGSTRAVNVVVTTKPVSMLLGSSYQQLARTQAVDDFDTWVRTALDELMTSPGHSSMGWLRTDLLRRHWTRPGWQTTLVDMSGRPETSTAKLWQQVVPRVSCPALAALDNRSYPAAIVAANQVFIRRHPDVTVSRFQDLQRRAFAGHLRDPDYGALGRFTLRPDVRSLLDRAFPQTGDDEMASRDVEELRQRLASSEPLTEVELAPGVSHRDWAKKVAGLASLLDREHKPLLAQRTARRVRTGLRSLHKAVEVE